MINELITLEILSSNSSFGLYHNSVTASTDSNIGDTKLGTPLKVPFKPRLLFKSRVLILKYKVLRKLRMKYPELENEFNKKERQVRAFGMPFCDFCLSHVKKDNESRL